MADTHKLRDAIAAQAHEAGFDSVGFARPASLGDAGARLRGFLAMGRHGDMAWMERPEREAPRALWPEVNTLIALGANYGPNHDPLEQLKLKRRAVISSYAQGADYHDVLKKRLKRIARWIVNTAGGDVKVFIDTAPVLEKPIAQAAGLGWAGKHTNLVSRDFGSWLFLGEIFTTLKLPPSAPLTDHCGSCSNCLDICPTKAFPAPYQLDARRCISYLTIEHKGHIPLEFRAPMGNRIYGCDDCLAICPWNKFAKTSRLSAFHPRTELQAPLLAELAMLDDAGFREVFRGSPVKRIGRDRFIRNVLIAIGNSEAPALAPIAVRLMDDASPLVRAMAIWGYQQLAPPAAIEQERRKREDLEKDPHVRAEWRLSCNQT